MDTDRKKAGRLCRIAIRNIQDRVSRNPDANTDRVLPSRVARNIVAFSGLCSAHSLHVEPTEMCIMFAFAHGELREVC